MATTQHERRVLERYEIDTLGAPFKVTVLDCVSLSVDEKTGEEKINVPDVIGLISAVVRARVEHPRKLNGKEIRFVRNALRLKANQIAKFLDMTPEHFSRCEKGSKIMALPSEKYFRLFAYVATHSSDPEDLLLKVIEGRTKLAATEIEKSIKNVDSVAKKLFDRFLLMKIESAFDVNKELNFEFWRKPLDENEPTLEPEEENWRAQSDERLVVNGY